MIGTIFGIDAESKTQF